jgi:hypothetical protein
MSGVEWLGPLRLLVGGGLLGYFIGRELDRREIERWKRCALKQGRFINQQLEIELGQKTPKTLTLNERVNHGPESHRNN